MNLSESISISIPTYNRARVLGELIERMLPQVSDLDEILVVDNASEDNTQQVCAQYKRIKYFRNPSTLSMTHNWNLCLEYSTKSWINVFHSDDLPVENYIATVRRVLERVPPSLVSTDWTWRTEPLEYSFFSPGRVACSFFDVPVSSVFIHQSVIQACGFFNDRFDTSPDQEYYARLAATFPRVVIHSPVLIIKRDLGDRELQNAVDARRYIQEYREVLGDISNHMGLSGIESQQFIARRLWHACMHLGRMFYSDGNVKVACDYLRLLPSKFITKRMMIKRYITKLFPKLYWASLV